MRLTRRKVYKKREKRWVEYYVADLGEVGAHPAKNPRCLVCRARQQPTRKYPNACKCEAPRWDPRLVKNRPKRMLGEVGVVSKEEAQAMYAELMLAKTTHTVRAYAEARFAPRSKTTFKEAVGQLTAMLKGRRSKPATLATLEHIVRNHLEPAFQHHDLRAIDRPAIDKFISAQTAKNYGPRTVNLHVAKLLQILHYQVEVGTLEKVPTVPRLTIRRGEAETAYTTDAEFIELFDAADLPRRALAAFGFYQGLRIGEAAYLRWDRVGLAAREIVIAEEPIEVNAKDRFEPKTQAGHRTVKMEEPVHEVLAELLETGVRFRSPWVFARPAEKVSKHWTKWRADGRPTKALLGSSWAYHCNAVGVHAPFRYLRRAWATNSAARGVDIRRLMHDAGWTTADIALRVYAQVKRDGLAPTLQPETPDQNPEPAGGASSREGRVTPCRKSR